MFRKIIKIGAITCAVLTIAIFVCTSTVLYVFTKSDGYVSFSKDKLSEVSCSLKIVDNCGNALTDALNCASGKQIKLSALHHYTYMAFVVVEDKRFFKHGGIDCKRLVGAAVHNAKSNSLKEGASTISQQLIKNTHLTSGKTIKRKVNEMLLALELENNYDKADILEIYLNTIYFGRNAYGIENAANTYFNKSASELTIAESATLAGMIKAPNVYAPDKNAQKCLARRNLVLKLMLDENVISPQEYQVATCKQLEYRPFVNDNLHTYCEAAIKEACEILGTTQNQLVHSSFTIKTYLNKQSQSALQEVAKQDTTCNKDGTLADLSCIVCNKNGEIEACHFRGEALTPKQIGSTAKPFAVYAPAFCEKLITQASPVLDEPTNFGGYKPQNAGKYYGWTTVKTAMEKSLNLPAVKTLNSLGLDKAQQYLNKLGICGKQNLSLALGNVEGGMTDKQLANCYVTLQNGGTNKGVAFVDSITNASGKVIYQRKPTSIRVFDEKSAFLVTDLLQGAVKQGTAKRLQSKFAIAAKTGTVGNSNGNTGALVCGYTTEHTFVVSFCGDMPNSVNGSTAPCELASKLLAKMYKNNLPNNFAQPQGIVRHCVDKDDLLNNQLLTLSSNGIGFLFDSANLPERKQQTPHYLLKVNFDGENVCFVLPDADGTWKIVGPNGKIAANETPATGKYHAELWQNGKCVYTTPTVFVKAD